MTTMSTDGRTTAFEPTEAIKPLRDTTADGRHAGAGRPAPGRYLALHQDGTERLLPLRGAITHIGRGFAADIQLEDVSVSRRHAIVTQRRGVVRILDDRSSNGTFVNGRRITEVELRDGDVIVLGRQVLQFVDVPAS